MILIYQVELTQASIVNATIFDEEEVRIPSLNQVEFDAWDEYQNFTVSKQVCIGLASRQVWEVTDCRAQLVSHLVHGRIDVKQVRYLMSSIGHREIIKEGQLLNYLCTGSSLGEQMALLMY